MALSCGPSHVSEVVSGEYGEQILAVAAKRRAASGFRGRFALALETIADTAATGARLHGEILAQELRYSVRTLRRAPGFASTAVLLSAIGIGAPTAAVAVADHVLLRPLPYANPHELVRFWQEDRTAGGYNVLSPGNYRDVVARSTSLTAVAAYTPQSGNLVGHGAPVLLEATWLPGTSCEYSDVRRPWAAPSRVTTNERASQSSYLSPHVDDAVRRRPVHRGPRHRAERHAPHDHRRDATGIHVPRPEHGVLGAAYLSAKRIRGPTEPPTCGPSPGCARSGRSRRPTPSSTPQRSTSSDSSRNRMRLGILTADLRFTVTRAHRTMVAASVILLVAVGLLAQAMWRVQSRDPGFDPQGVLTLRTTLP